MKIFQAALSWLTAILVPVALVFLGLRLLLTPAFLNVEYRMPGFPVDSFGFSFEERLKWSEPALKYLVNNAGVEYLGDLTFPDGTPLYNQRELSHMLDVKKVVKPVLSIGYATWIVLVGLGGVAFLKKWQQNYTLGLRRGGWITIGLFVMIGTFAAINFWEFFTLFHGLFFKGDSWLFLYSDTLIRLFPIRFWQDAFLLAGIVTLGGSLALVIGLKPRNHTGV
jgi:integral membrane protein (TIGR01906 family)